jgi:hypothetical protein
MGLHHSPMLQQNVYPNAYSSICSSLNPAMLRNPTLGTCASAPPPHSPLVQLLTRWTPPQPCQRAAAWATPCQSAVQLSVTAARCAHGGRRPANATGKHVCRMLLALCKGNSQPHNCDGPESSKTTIYRDITKGDRSVTEGVSRYDGGHVCGWVGVPSCHLMSISHQLDAHQLFYLPTVPKCTVRGQSAMYLKPHPTTRQPNTDSPMPPGLPGLGPGGPWWARPDCF